MKEIKPTQSTRPKQRTQPGDKPTFPVVSRANVIVGSVIALVIGGTGLAIAKGK